MLQGAKFNTDIFNPLVPKAHNIVVKIKFNFHYKLSQKSQLKLVFRFLFMAPSALMG